MVPSEAEDGSIGTRASVLRTLIRTFMEDLCGCQDHGTVMGTDEELVDMAVRAAAGKEFKELVGIEQAWHIVDDTYHELCTERKEYLRNCAISQIGEMRMIICNIEEFSLPEAVLKARINAAEGHALFGVPLLPPSPKSKGKQKRGASLARNAISAQGYNHLGSPALPEGHEP